MRVSSCRLLTDLPCPVRRATEQAMSREMKGESGVLQAWLETSITGLHALVGRIQV